MFPIARRSASRQASQGLLGPPILTGAAQSVRSLRRNAQAAMMRLIPARAGIAAGLMLAAIAAGHAQGGRCHGGASFEQWLDAFRREALALGIGRATLEHALADA